MTFILSKYSFDFNYKNRLILQIYIYIHYILHPCPLLLTSTYPQIASYIPNHLPFWAARLRGVILHKLAPPRPGTATASGRFSRVSKRRIQRAKHVCPLKLRNREFSCENSPKRINWFCKHWFSGAIILASGRVYGWDFFLTQQDCLVPHTEA